MVKRKAPGSVDQVYRSRISVSTFGCQRPHPLTILTCPQRACILPSSAPCSQTPSVSMQTISSTISWFRSSPEVDYPPKPFSGTYNATHSLVQFPSLELSNTASASSELWLSWNSLASKCVGGTRLGMKGIASSYSNTFAMLPTDQREVVAQFLPCLFVGQHGGCGGRMRVHDLCINLAIGNHGSCGSVRCKPHGYLVTGWRI